MLLGQSIILGCLYKLQRVIISITHKVIFPIFKINILGSIKKLILITFRDKKNQLTYRNSKIFHL